MLFFLFFLGCGATELVAEDWDDLIADHNSGEIAALVVTKMEAEVAFTIVSKPNLWIVKLTSVGSRNERHP